MRKERRQLRRIVQLTCFAAAIALLWPLSDWVAGSRLFPQISPFVALCAAIAGKAIGAGLGIGWTVAAIAIFRPRWFCRYICPAGLLFEECARRGLRKTAWWSHCPAVGGYIALVTAIGATVGYPLFLWLDPLAIFGSAFTAVFAQTATAAILAGALFFMLLILSATSGLLWCSRLCPLGGTQDLLGAVKPFSDRIRQKYLLKAAEPQNGPTGTPFLRRSFILFTAGIGIAIWGKASGAARGENAPLRPPGAVAEKTFAGICFRCGNCVRACPSKIIQADLGQGGIAGLLAPLVRYTSGYCLESCRTCTQVCPSGALEELELAQKCQYRIGEALVDGEICLLVLGKRDCDSCARSCPFDAITIHWDEELYMAYPLVHPEKCNGCGACEVACPCEGIKAIRVWRTMEVQT